MRPAPSWRQFPRYPAVTGTILAAVLVSVARWTDHDVSFLLVDGHVRRGEVWRFASSALPHVNLVHLLFNAYWVWAFGTLVESVLGSLATSALFVFLAVVSGAAEYALFDGGIGLSGVGYGLFGLLWVASRHDLRFAGSVDEQRTVLFVAWFFLCIVATLSDVMPVANVAHGVGAITGALVGRALVWRGRRRMTSTALVGLLAFASLLGATVARPYVTLSSHPGLDDARLGYEALRERRNDDAVRWLVEATRLEPKNAGAWFNLGIAYQRLARAREAAIAYERAFTLRPDDVNFRQAHEAMRGG